MPSYLRVVITFVLMMTMLASCEDDDNGSTPDPNNTTTPEDTANPQDNNQTPDDMVYGQAQIQWEHYVGDQPLELDQRTYTNANGDTFAVSKWNYYITDLQLVHEDGRRFALEPRHILVREEASETKQHTIDSLPPGRYTQIQYTIGLDSLTNMREDKIQEGALNPLFGMYWRWATGYIFVKFEGRSPNADSSNNALTYHIGGSQDFAADRAIRLDIDTELEQGQTLDLRLRADLAELFTNPHPVDFLDFPGTMQIGPKSKRIADNYARMFSVTSVDVQ